VKSILDFISGKKTYIVAILVGLGGAAQVLGYHVPDAVWPILGGLGLGAVRDAIGKSA
jgi:hypothetical protein